MTGTTSSAPLQGFALLDLTNTEAGRFCATLLADMGVHVTRIDAGEGAGQASDTFLNRALLRNRSVVRGETRAGLIEEQLALHHVVLTDDVRDVPDLSSFPGVLHCSVTPFGIDSPWAQRAGSDLVIQTLSGFMELTGTPGRPPIRMGARVLPLMAGAIAAVQIISGLLNERQGAGTCIDVAVLDVALNTLTYMAPLYLTLGQVPEKVGSGHTTIYPYNAFQTASGYLVAAPFTGRFWRHFCQAIDMPELATDERFRDFQNRLDNRAILEPILNARMLEKPRDEWLEILRVADVPCGPVNSVAEAIEMDVSQARELVAQMDTAGTVKRFLGLPLKFVTADGAVFQPTYQAARDTLAKPVGPARANPAAATQPLAGIRVVDLTRMAAGPYCTQMLVDLGAEVIKVEEPKIGDPTRRNVPYIGRVSSYFYAFNRGKRSVALDMKTPDGNAAVRKLMAEADIVVENFRPGVMERLGFDFATLNALNPRLILASISGFGQTGPMREKISFDLVNQAIAGMLSITSEPGEPPARLGMAVGDLGGGLFAALGILAALAQRERSGQGAAIDISLHDVLVTLLGGIAQDYLTSGVAPGPIGTEHAHHVPERVFATSDGHVALEAWTDEGWASLASLPEFATLADGRLASLAARLAARDEVHAAIAAVLAGHTAGHWLERLQRPGIGIAPILTIAGALDNPHVAARDLVVTNSLGEGVQGRTMGSAFRVNGEHLGTHAPPPALGAETAAILGQESAA